MITKNDDGSVSIVVDKIHLKLNPNPLTQFDIDLITAYNPENTEEVIAGEIKMREVHAKILQLDQLELIAEMIEFDPNGWFVSYCTMNNITFA